MRSGRANIVTAEIGTPDNSSDQLTKYEEKVKEVGVHRLVDLSCNDPTISLPLHLAASAGCLSYILVFVNTELTDFTGFLTQKRGGAKTFR